MTLIIAEAGVNHNGDEALAYKLIDVAKESGADIVKFQTFKAKNLVTRHAQQAKYQAINIGKAESQFEMLARLELPLEAHFRLMDYCKSLNIEFLSTAFDSESLDFLVNQLNLTRLKIPSGEITNAPFLLQHARTNCNVILSTGMATLAEVEQALSVLAFGYTAPQDAIPSISAFQEAYCSEAGQLALKKQVTLLHCTSEYPAPLEDINLSAMNTLADAFGVKAGYSDHSEGIIVPIAAVARGAVVIEKHFTLDKDMEGPDHKASLNPDELKAMVKGIRSIEMALGNGIKEPRPSELKNRDIIRKSLVAARDISAGECLSPECLSIKRPGNGTSPFKYWEILSTQSSRSYKTDDELYE